ncbi:MAG: DeoR family transcriptional regulator [Lachnospiraceae bacterium]|nr:DeoR family transcriptional regulator [Lachnospiraceae bacterium]
MQKLIELLKDGRSRTIEMLAEELGESTENVQRDMDFLERMGVIRRTGYAEAQGHDCSTCGGCKDGQKCKSCAPEGGFKNMGTMWEVLKEC